jgi:hypothetical protein
MLLSLSNGSHGRKSYHAYLRHQKRESRKKLWGTLKSKRHFLLGPVTLVHIVQLGILYFSVCLVSSQGTLPHTRLGQDSKEWSLHRVRVLKVLMSHTGSLLQVHMQPLLPSRFWFSRFGERTRKLAF